jgi:hypothetical protein
MGNYKDVVSVCDQELKLYPDDIIANIYKGLALKNLEIKMAQKLQLTRP